MVAAAGAESRQAIFEVVQGEEFCHAVIADGEDLKVG
jgi:hypothetical protein